MVEFKNVGMKTRAERTCRVGWSEWSDLPTRLLFVLLPLELIDLVSDIFHYFRKNDGDTSDVDDV